MMYRQKIGPRLEHREKEAQRVQDAPCLAEQFQQLKSLTVELEYYNQDCSTKNKQIKYMVNLDNAKSVFLFHCPNAECIRGDFDLTAELATAVAQKQTRKNGEISCQGWKSKTTIDTVHCNNILRYTFSLAY